MNARILLYKRRKVHSPRGLHLLKHQQQNKQQQQQTTTHNNIHRDTAKGRVGIEVEKKPSKVVEVDTNWTSSTD